MSSVGENKIMIFGGHDCDNFCQSDELWMYTTSPSSMKWTLLNTATGVIGTPPSARFGHAMTTIGKKILLFGGKSKTRDEVKLYNDALLFDTEAFQWTLLPQNEAFDALTVRNNHEMVSVGDKVLLFGDDSS
eukprot:CAMPEP_0179483968 /NCGR_PEP_ID=MMETSP0799-20121207/60982_1 /TAXON_ID=46947 /ORGANISM="Geminigera cryophila, Strain CCMP2564" /LENGTH=131 /DNA_ID=CAMNT_0021297677 /DNA_START=63 /DNA_END=455 /DNA_ORIENTATION=-